MLLQSCAPSGYLLTSSVCVHGWWFLRVTIYVFKDQRLPGEERDTSYSTPLRVSIPDTLMKIVLIHCSWSAVVRGAVTKGLEKGVGAVLKRKSRRHYGTSCARLFQKRAHKRVDMFTDWHSGKKMANNQMKWLIEKGQTLLASEATHAATGFMLRWWVGEEKQIVWKLLSCDADIAPSRSVDKVSKPLRRSNTANIDQSVYRVAVLTVDSNDIPLVYLKRNTSPCGRQYYSINVTVHISLQSSLDFYVTIKGKKFGSLTVSYD